MDPAAPGGRPDPQQSWGGPPHPQQPPVPPQQPYGTPPPGYGPPAAPYPYGGGYGPYPPPPRQGGDSHNGLAIAALVTGIVCCLPPLGLILGLIALRQIRRTGQRGKGMAVAGVALSAVSTLLVVVWTVSGAAGEFWRGFSEGVEEATNSSSPFDLEKGDCFDIPGAEVPDETETASVPTVDCAEPHDAEVTGGYRLRGSDGYPGSAADDTAMERRCNAISDAHVPDPTALAPHIANYYYLPTRESWALGDRTVTCALAATEGKLTGTLADGAGTDEGTGEGADGATGGTGDTDGGAEAVTHEATGTGEAAGTDEAARTGEAIGTDKATRTEEAAVTDEAIGTDKATRTEEAAVTDEAVGTDEATGTGERAPAARAAARAAAATARTPDGGTGV